MKYQDVSADEAGIIFKHEDEAMTDVVGSQVIEQALRHILGDAGTSKQPNGTP